MQTSKNTYAQQQIKQSTHTCKNITTKIRLEIGLFDNVKSDINALHW